MRKIRSVFLLLVCLFIFSCQAKKSEHTESSAKPGEDEHQYKILHIMSYHSPWKWTDDQFIGFKEVLQDLNIEYMVRQLDQKHSTQLQLDNAVREAKAAIENWQPDLVYTTDDFVQTSVVPDYLGSELPFVFSGLNQPPGEYGFLDCDNVAGVIEQELFLPVINLLKRILPELKRIAIITDSGATWPAMVERMRAKAERSLPDIEVVGWDFIDTFDEYKRKMMAYQDEVDAVGLLGVFLFKDQQGNNVPFTEVLQWTVANSFIPDFSFWADRIPKGTLCAVAVSGYEQGLAAGRLARKILVDKARPSDFSFESTVKGEPVINLARARKLGLEIESDLLLTAEVINEFLW